MGGSHLHSLYNSTRASRTKRLTAACLHPIRRYGGASHESSGQHVEERAASTAEEFKRVSEEKAKVVKAKEKHGTASQTAEKVHDGAEEAVLGEGKTESVKEKYKEPVGKGNFRRTGDEQTTID